MGTTPAASQVATPAPGSGALDIWFKAPLNGATVSGVLNAGTSCYANGTGVTRVDFRVDNTAIGSDTTMSNGMQCVLDTTTLSNGSHTLTATARSSSGATRSDVITINVQNAVNQAPNVTLSAPSAASGTISFSASATDDKAVARVVFAVDGTTILTDTSAPYGGTLNTTTLANGSHTLTATAFDAEGRSNTASVALNVSNTAPGGSTGGTSTPPPGSGTLDVWFKAPLNGSTVSGTLSGTRCYVAGNGIARVEFRAGSTVINTDTAMADGMQCVLDTTRLANGNHTLTARAYSPTGATRDDVITVNVQNAAGGGAANAAPNVSFTAPTGTSASGTITYAASATDDRAVARVVFAVDGTTVLTDTTAPYSGTLNTTTLANGAHTLTATAYDADGLSQTASMTLNVQNGTGGGGNDGGTSTLPSTGTQAIATFESIGLYWRPGANPGTAGCAVRYRRTGETAWKDGLAMWYDSRNAECRGSLVHLAPGTDYEVQMGYGGTFRAGRVVKTWAEQYPIARTVTIPSGSAQYNITEGGTANGYVLYTGGTLDAANGADYNIRVSAPYVIIRGMTLRNARVDAIRINPGAHDVVIERNEISGWGRSRGGNLGVDGDSAVRAICSSSWRAERVVVQDNRIHSPRYTANTWSSGHPAGPQAITLWECGGNHVLRHNEIYSTNGNHYNDAIGAGENYSTIGFPAFDTDIYGNRITHTNDDGIESEGGNRNVRIWGNYIDATFVGIASTATHAGPLYVFRNVYNNGNTFAKSGQNSGYGGGRRYFFHNTVLIAGEGIKGNTGQPLTNAVTRNNVLQMRSAGGMAIGMISGSNDFDYDMSNGNMRPYSGAEAHGFVGSATWASGHGPSSGANGNYQLAPGSRGFDQALRIPNFNDAFGGAAPDVGAHEGGTPAMKFGVR